MMVPLSNTSATIAKIRRVESFMRCTGRAHGRSIVEMRDTEAVRQLAALLHVLRCFVKNYLAHDAWQSRFRKMARCHPTHACWCKSTGRKAGGVNRELERKMRENMADNARQAA